MLPIFMVHIFRAHHSGDRPCDRGPEFSDIHCSGVYKQDLQAFEDGPVLEVLLLPQQTL